MLTESDKQWLARYHPGLSVESDDKITGEVEFTATYNKESGRFLQIEPDIVDGVGGLRLSGKFRITVVARTVFRDLRLPALTVEGIDAIPDRHFNQFDFSACVCNPLEEDEFLERQFDFQRYFKELVVPFLYGQLYFSREGHWPWFDYAHGGLGTIEAFSRNPTPAKAEECVQRIAREVQFWKIVKPLLLQKSDIKGHTLCTCPRRDHLRRCHPVALTGLRLLKRVMKEHGIELP
ncbi:hypothetical protein EBR66_00005 [bacterium]|nr:hypothetical protein [bacterium]